MVAVRITEEMEKDVQANIRTSMWRRSAHTRIHTHANTAGTAGYDSLTTEEFNWITDRFSQTLSLSAYVCVCVCAAELIYDLMLAQVWLNQ